VRGHVYDPLSTDHAALFKEFAALEPSDENVLGFARRYGHLGAAVEIGLSDEEEGFRKYGESLRTWEYEIQWMRHALEAYDHLVAKDSEWFRARIHWPGLPLYRSHDGPPDGSVTYTVHRERAVADRPFWDHGIWLFDWDQGPFELSHLLSGRSELGAASVLIMTLINKRLVPNTSLRLIWDEEAQSPREHVVPRNLIGLVWLQAARMVSGNVRFFTCEHCGKPFELSHRAKRADAKYCGDNCRFAAYRVRKKTSP